MCEFQSDFLCFRPEEPTEADCCHGGCENCVFDVYRKAIEKWNMKLEQSNISSRSNVLSLTRFKPFNLVSMKKLTEDTNFYRFETFCNEENSTIGSLSYGVAQYLSLRLEVNTEVEHVKEGTNLSTHRIRNFTIISLVEETKGSYFDMIIKLYKNSLTSNYIKQLLVGDLTFWRGPYGNFSYKCNEYSNLIMLCMGTGIAPMYPVCKKIISNEQDETVINLLYGCRCCSDIILRKELHELASYWNFHYSLFLSKEVQIEQKYCFENFVNSRITYDHVYDCISSKKKFLVLICGSDTFSNDMISILSKVGVSKSNIYVF